MLNLTELRQEASECLTEYVLDPQEFLQLINIAEAAKRHSDSFRDAHGVLVVGPPEKQIEVTNAAIRLDKLLEDVEIGDE